MRETLMIPCPYYRLDTLLVWNDVLYLPLTRTGSADITTPVHAAMRDTLSRLFQAPVVECNVEPAVTEDADPLSGSIHSAWYRGTGRGRVKGTLRAREKSCIL